MARIPEAEIERLKGRSCKSPGTRMNTRDLG